MSAPMDCIPFEKTILRCGHLTNTQQVVTHTVEDLNLPYAENEYDVKFRQKCVTDRVLAENFPCDCGAAIWDDRHREPVGETPPKDLK